MNAGSRRVEARASASTLRYLVAAIAVAANIRLSFGQCAEGEAPVDGQCESAFGLSVPARQPAVARAPRARAR